MASGLTAAKLPTFQNQFVSIVLDFLGKLSIHFTNVNLSRTKSIFIFCKKIIEIQLLKLRK